MDEKPGEGGINRTGWWLSHPPEYGRSMGPIISHCWMEKIYQPNLTKQS